ncbi:hypothetical protein D769_19293 [Cupriavidus sp. HMR-1]|uniref:hypothetical protein n=1 Tax=Cupriavidus sp. HMR-1 TaxID=1249621 RepID=UPI0002A27FB1|nr:hypothetical protein [Cupriavidus sp. HMR-1]EKZ97634.1 hypothetical protein D769_19293 [Cupriavidus sp. HMR-1]
MLDGALVGGTCYLNQGAAADAYYSAAAPSQVPGGTSYLSAFVKVSGAWVLRRYQISSTGDVAMLADAAVPVIQFPPCDPAANFMDGMTVGWGVVAAMFLAWGVVYLRRGL